MNINIFNKLSKENNKILISPNDTEGYLIILCETHYDEEMLKKYLINSKFSNLLENKKEKLIYKLKNKYNFIEY